MKVERRHFLAALASGAAARVATPQTMSKKLGIPGPYPGRVIAVEHPGSIVSGQYQREAVREMLRRGIMELTGAPSPTEAWRVFFEPGDVVGIKVNPVGQPYLISKAEVFQSIVEGLNLAGVKNKDIVAYDRYKSQFLSGGFDKWLPDGVRWTWASDDADSRFQLDMGGYDRDVFMEMALTMPGAPDGDHHYRRSYASRFISKDVNKVINLGVLKHHQSAGVTIALKNLSHGMVNNVARSHISSSNNACGMFIPTVVDMPVLRQKVVLNIIDGILGGYHGGPGGNVRKFLWENKTLYFATDPVAVDRVGWNALDDQRGRAGMQPISLAYQDNDSHFVRMQPEHIEIAAAIGLGIADESKIDLRKLKLG